MNSQSFRAAYAKVASLAFLADLVFDPRPDPVAVVPGQNGGTTTFRYDPFGRRIEKSGPLGTTNYLYDGDNAISEIDQTGSIVVAKYVQGPSIDEPLSEFRSNTSGYYDQDGLGSVTSLSNSAGGLSKTYTFDSFGKVTASSGTVANPFQYSGREFDSETGLLFYRARYFDPAGGRFISEDPIGFVGSSNFYVYVNNDPIIYADPSGLCGGNGKKKLTPAQCKAAKTLLDREQKYSTTTAAWMSAIGFGDGTIEPFNSSVPGQSYTDTALGPVKVDWFTDLRLTTLIPGPQIPAYIFGKLVWTGERAVTGAPITNYVPFQDPVESRTMALAVEGKGFRSLFPPEFMKENCGQ